MHPTLAAALTQTVRFKPMIGLDMHGRMNYGPATAPIRCRYVSPTLYRRFQDVRDENESPSVVILVHADDFDPKVTSTGSLATHPNGEWRVITAIDAPQFIDGTVHHYRLTI